MPSRALQLVDGVGVDARRLDQDHPDPPWRQLLPEGIRHRRDRGLRRRERAAERRCEPVTDRTDHDKRTVSAPEQQQELLGDIDLTEDVDLELPSQRIQRYEFHR